MVRRLAFVANDAFALVGSDTFNEYQPQNIDAEVLEPIVGLRFALAATTENAGSIAKRIAVGDQLRIGTSYPRTAANVLGMAGVALSMDEMTIVSGGVESLPWQPELGVDAVFELVQSGVSLRQNGLVIVADDLQSVELLKVTKNQR